MRTPGFYITTTDPRNPTARHHFFSVADLTQIIRTADGDRLARSDELAAVIVDALNKET
jgi:hypothetical protein